MTDQKNTKDEIEEILKTNFKPKELIVIDESHEHRNHREAKAKPEAGHFKVIMKSDRFNGLSQVARHRLVYQALSHLMQSHIHALSMTLNVYNDHYKE